MYVYVHYVGQAIGTFGVLTIITIRREEYAMTTSSDKLEILLRDLYIEGHEEYCVDENDAPFIAHAIRKFYCDNIRMLGKKLCNKGYESCLKCPYVKDCSTHIHYHQAISDVINIVGQV